MKRIVLVRHGQSTWNLDRRFCGWSDPDLSELGRWQAEQLAESFNGRTFDTVWASDLKRAQQTAQLAWGHHQTDPRLREIHFGDLEGQTWRDLPETMRTALKDFSSFEAPGGETTDKFRERIDSFCEDLTDGTHLVFCHGGVIRVLLADLDVNEFVSNASVAEITWSPRALLRLVAGPQRDAT